jgi:hypothetical protein
MPAYSGSTKNMPARQTKEPNAATHGFQNLNVGLKLGVDEAPRAKQARFVQQSERRKNSETSGAIRLSSPMSRSSWTMNQLNKSAAIGSLDTPRPRLNR